MTRNETQVRVLTSFCVICTQVEKQALCGELAAARQRLAEVVAAQDAAGAAADAHMAEDAAQSALAAKLQAELQHAK